jgi:esterase
LATHDAFGGPTRFIRGARSRFLVEDDMPEILSHFPSASLIAVPDAGHNVHFDNLAGFLAAWQDFLPSAALQMSPPPPPFAD